MLRDLGCRYVIVGHSERRMYFGERDENIQKKVRAALRHGLSPILCVGESLAEREAGQTESVVTSSTQRQPGRVNHTRSGDRHNRLRTGLGHRHRTSRHYGAGRDRASLDPACSLRPDGIATTASAIRILYGGSVTPQNIESLLVSDAIDGALVGGACLNPDSFATIINLAQIQRA